MNSVKKVFLNFGFFYTLAGCFMAAAANGSPADSVNPGRPSLHHVLLEVGNIKASVRFYHDFLGLAIGSRSDNFATLESANAGIYLWQGRWGWEKPDVNGEHNGRGIYPHFEVADVAGTVAGFRRGGYAIVQEPRSYDWGTEAFVQDPDGYIIALVSMSKAKH